MNWPLRASTIAAITLCASATVLAAAPADRADWTSGVMRKLHRHLSMPEEAQGLDSSLSLRLRLTVMRDGKIAAVELASSSGYVAVDIAVTRMIQRASPLPAFPADMTADKEILMLPVRFEVEDQPARPSRDVLLRYADPARGFGVTVPAPYQIAQVGKSEEFDVLVQIASTTGTPQAASAAGYLCGVGFSAPRKTLKTHPGAEAPLSAASRLAAAVAILAAQGESPGQRSGFELQGVKGIDYVAPTSSGANGVPLLQYNALLDSPTLRVAMRCTTTSRDLPGALSAFRQIRDGISLGKQ